MKCPVDGATLVISERSGVEVDYCPTCRGVWLDRGELDKIIERGTVEMPERGRYGSEGRYSGRGDNDERYDDDDEYGRGNRRKRGGFLSDIFGD